MSTIATTNLKHPSSAVNNMVLSSNGTVTAGVRFIGAGIDLISQQSFSSVSSVIFNNVFSSSYENYHIVTRLIGNSAGSHFIRFRTAGVNLTSSSYRQQAIYSDYGSSTVNANAMNFTTNLQIGYATTATEPSVSFSTIFNPFGSSRTSYVQNLAGTTSAFICNGYMNVDNSFDGFEVYPTSGTFSGTIRVYGLENT